MLARTLIFFFTHFIIQAIGDDPLCTLPDTLDISYSICNGWSNTTGSVEGFTATFCDISDPPICMVQILATNSEPGSTYSDSFDASGFNDQILNIEFTGVEGSKDAVCLDSFIMNGEQFISQSFFIESQCEESSSNPCPCDRYPTGSIIFKCQEWDGSSDLNLLIEDENFVTDIPANVQGLTITLAAQGDLDLQLYSGFSDNRGTCLAGYGCLHGSQVASRFEWEGMEIFFSGDDRSNPVSETITVDVVKTPLSLFVKSFETTAGTVYYSWDAVEPCDFDNHGCNDCDAFFGCKDGMTPVCDGSEYIKCVDPTLAPTAERDCDEYETERYPQECLETFTIERTKCTEYPTGFPTTDTPSKTPSIAPTATNPSRKPSPEPTISGPTGTPSSTPTSNRPTLSPSIPQRCEKASQFALQIETCDVDTADSKDMALVAEFCDVDGQCAQIALDPSPNERNTKYTYEISSYEAYDIFTDHIDSITFIPNSNDGICISKLTTDTNTESSIIYDEGPYWVDAECTGQLEKGECACNEYPESNVIWECQAWEGSSSMAMIIGTETWVTDIPVGVTWLNITLTSNADFDLQLYPGWKTERTDQTPCMVGYECIQAGREESIETWPEYDNMIIIFSGDHREAPVTEYIMVAETTIKMSLFVRSYGTGEGQVVYNWQAIEPCDFERFGCAPCDDYAGCKDGLVPVCDGSKFIICVPEAEQQEKQEECDEYLASDVQACETEFPLPECLSWIPSVSPSTEPSEEPSYFPSTSPTPREDCWHFKLGECGCPEQLPLDVVFILDSSDSIPDDEWEGFTETLAVWIEQELPNTARLGLMQFSTKTDIIIPITTNWDPTSWAQKVRNLQRLSGATWTRRAINAGWYDMWNGYIEANDIQVGERVMITVMITDGAPSYLNTHASQSPCDEDTGQPVSVVQEYFNSGIEIQSIVIGDWEATAEQTLKCMQEEPLTVFVDLSQPQLVINRTLSKYILPCAEQSYSEYNGRYSVVLESGVPVPDQYGRYTYLGTWGWVVYWTEEGFVFVDQKYQILERMSEVDATLTEQLDYKYPRNGSDFIYNGVNGPELRPEQIICCDGIPAPSRAPSTRPSDSPIIGTRNPTTSYPSTVPTTETPTTTPDTSAPTVSPSVSPSTTPTTNKPTEFPTTDQPTMFPHSSPPTTDQPTMYPHSSAPTFTQPTVGPISGTHSPTVPAPSGTPSVIPSRGPTTSPTINPSNNPTTATPSGSPSQTPTSDQPTRSPETTKPTPSPTSGPTTSPTTLPSPSPTTAPTTGPSVSPTVMPSAAPTKWDCTKQSELKVTLTVCTEPATSGTATGIPVALFTDIMENSVSFPLAPGGNWYFRGPLGPFEAGRTYEWVLPTNGFEQQVVDFELSMTDSLGDGLCIKEVTVTSEYMEDPTNTIHVNDAVTSENGLWLDEGDCAAAANDNSCPCGQFDTGGLQFVCQETSNSRSVNMIIGTESWITWIPRHVHELSISLTATSDLDLKLYNCTGGTDFSCEASDLCLAGYDCLNEDEGTFEYQDMEIYFSGDNRVAPVTESIYIAKVTEPLGLYIRSYQSGTGVVAYSWDRVDPCPEDITIGCNVCADWGACKDGDIPVCFGGENPVCTDADDAEQYQATCDDWTSEALSQGDVSCGPVELNLRGCIAPPSTAPTRTPSSTPSISEPTHMPSRSPSVSMPTMSPDTSAPSTQPSKTPTVTLPCEKNEIVQIEIVLCDAPDSAGSAHFSLTAHFTDADEVRGSHPLILPGGGTLVSPGETLRFEFDESDLAMYSNQIIEWELTTDSTDGIGIKMFRFNGQDHWNEQWYDEDVECVWIDQDCEPNDHHCECGTYPDSTLFCQEWYATNYLNMILGDQLWVFDAPIGATNVTVNMSANVDFDLKLIPGLFADESNPVAPQECYIGYGCQKPKAGYHQVCNPEGNTCMMVEFSGDVREDNSDMISEELRIEVVTLPVSVWVRAWNTGEGEVSWTWDGLEGCTWITEADCLPCKEYDCNNLNPVCFGDYPPRCLGNEEWVQEQQSCDDYDSSQVEKQSIGGGLCGRTTVELPSCLTAPPTVNPTVDPSNSPTQFPTTDQPSVIPTVSPTMSPTWPCCDGSDIITGVIGICGNFGECDSLTTNTECEAVGIPEHCTDDYTPTTPTECLGSCFWDGECKEWTTQGSSDLTLEFKVTDIRGNEGMFRVSGPWQAGERRNFEYDYIADGIPFQIVDVSVAISLLSSFPDDGICIDYLELELDDLSHNNVLLDEELWLDGNCNDNQHAKTCPCQGYAVENITYRCQEWDGFSQVTMSPGQHAWIADIPVGVENVKIELDANAAYDLYAIEFPADYESGNGFTYNFNTVSDEDFLLTCLVGNDCSLQTTYKGMNIIVTPTDEKQNMIEFDQTTVNVVIYVIGRAADGTAQLRYEYVGPEMCSADLRCEPCPMYECKNDEDGIVQIAVCDGLGDPYCEPEAVAFDLQRQCDDISPSDQCSTSLELQPDQCRDCYTEPPTLAPFVSPTDSPTTAIPSKTPSVNPTTQPYPATPNPTPFEPCTCYTPETVSISIKICDAPESGSSESGQPVVRLCDNAGICNDFQITGSLSSGALIEQDFTIDGITYQKYDDFLVTAKLIDMTEDGFCVEDWSVNDYPLPDNVGLSDVFWVDGDCTGHINACDCGYYPEGAIQYSCDEHTGQSEVSLSVQQETWIADIPINVVDLNIQLESSVDLDLQLYVDQTGIIPFCLAGYGCDHDIGEPWFVYEGMNISFTGDDRVDPVTETLSIDKTTVPLSLYVKSYGNGGGTVYHSWSGMEPCPAERSGCKECNTYVGCKDDLVPVCDGSAYIVCALPEDRVQEQRTCDDYDPELYFSPEQIDALSCGEIEVAFPDCNTCLPTVSPSVDPTVKPSGTPTTTPSVAPTKGPSRTPSVIPSTSPSRSPVPQPTGTPTLSAPSASPTVQPSNIPTTSPTSAPTFSPTDSSSPTTSPTSSPSVSPTTGPTTEPTTSPTWCPYICIWDCYSEEGCTEACNMNVTAAVNEANAECFSQLQPLKDRVEDAETELAAIEQTCTQCSELNVNVDLLVDILTQAEVEKWQGVVDSGASCTLVSTNFCAQIDGCAMADGNCIDLTTRSPSLSSPSQSPVPCGPDVDAWQAVVDNGTACSFVPLDTCVHITQCQLNENGDNCENRLTGAIIVQSFSNIGLTSSITLDFPTIDGMGNVTVLVTTSAITVDDIGSDSVICTSETVDHEATITISQDCQMDGGVTYFVYAYSKYHNQVYLIGPDSIIIPHPSLTLEYIYSSNQELGYNYEVSNHNKDGAVYLTIVDTLCSDSVSQAVAGDDVARKSIDCAFAGGYTYRLEGVVDMDSQSPTAEETIATMAFIEFTIPGPNLTAWITDTDVNTGFAHSWFVEYSAASMGGMMYWAAVATSKEVAYSASDVIRDNNLNGGFDASCWGTASQDDSANHVMQSCPLEAGESYVVYYALDLDGQGGDAFLAEVLSFSLESTLGTLSVRSPSTDGFIVDYVVDTPSSSGNIYFTLDDGTPTAEDIIDSTHGCANLAAQTGGAQTITISCPGELQGGETYNLWTAIDSDGAGSDPQLLQGFPVAFTLAAPTVFVRRYEDICDQGLTVSYSISNLNENGKLYYGVAEEGSPPPSVEDVVDGNLACPGSVDQNDGNLELSLVCSLTRGASYEFWVASDINGLGEGALLAHSSGSRTTFDIPTTYMIIDEEAGIVPSTDNEGYNGLDFTYTLGDPEQFSRIAFAWSIRLKDDPVPTNLEELTHADKMCSGTLSVVDDQEHTDHIDCQLDASVRYAFDYIVGCTIGTIEFKSLGPALFLDPDHSPATSTSWQLRYEMTNPAWVNGLIYWAIPPADWTTFVPVPNIKDGTDMLCFGTFPQEDEEPKVREITSCELENGNSYQVYVILDTESDRLDTNLAQPNPQTTLTIPTPSGRRRRI